MKKSNTAVALCITLLVAPLSWCENTQTTVKISPRIRTHESIENQYDGRFELSKIESFLDFPLMIEKNNKLNAMGKIVSSNTKGKLSNKGDFLYVKNIESLHEGAVVDIVNKGDVVAVPGTKNVLGVELVKAGEGKIIYSGPISKVLITKNIMEIDLDSLVVPNNKIELSGITPHLAPENAPKKTTQIYSIYGEHTNIGGNLSVVSIGLGEQNGIEKGDVFFVYRALTAKTDQNTPKKRFHRRRSRLKDSSKNYNAGIIHDKNLIGELMVISVFSSVSYAIVTSAAGDVEIGDAVTNKKDQ